MPVARTGTQHYLPSELGLPGSDLLPVLRPEDEVFAPACMASFEGKPVTDDHPPDPEGVDADNIRRLQVGHAQNLRRGEGPERNLLLADLVITDPDTVRRVLEGKREISCGYTYRLSEEKGQYVQREIRGNHIAIVDKGRAGPRVAIRDHLARPVQIQRRNVPMKKQSGKTMMKLVSAALKANDLEPEELTEVLALVQAVEAAEEAVEEAAAAPAETGEATVVILPETEEAEVPIPEEDEDPESTAEDPILTRLDRILELLTRLAGLSDETVEAACDEEEEEEEDPDVFLVAPVEPEEEETSEARDRALRAGLKALRPVIAGLPKDKQRAATDAALKAMRKTAGNPYAALLRPAAKVAGGKEVGQRIMKARNCNYQ